MVYTTRGTVMKVNSYVVPLSLFHWLALDGAYLVAKTLDVLTAMVPRVGCAVGSKQFLPWTNLAGVC